MKAFKKFAGCIALVLAVVALILMLATPGIKYSVKSVLGNGATTIEGVKCIFGKTDEAAANWAGVTAFVLVVLGVLATLALSATAFVGKKSPLKKNAKLISFVACVLLVAAGVVTFFIVPAFKAANGDGSFALGSVANATYSIAAGWIVAAILDIVAGLVALCPAVLKK